MTCALISVWRVCTFSQPAPLNDLFCAIEQVETRGLLAPYPAHDIGPYQISEVCWQDQKMEGQWPDVLNRQYAQQVMMSNWSRYVPVALDNRDFEALAKMHFGGPRGRFWLSAERYWILIEKEIQNCGRSSY